MTKYWNKIKEKFVNENGIISLGFSDVIGSGLSGIFWLYIASVIEPGDYGEIHYFLGIAGMAQIFSMFGNPHALTVYSAKNENIQSTLFTLNYSNNNFISHNFHAIHKIGCSIVSHRICSV